MKKFAILIMCLVGMVAVANTKKAAQMKITLKDGTEARFWVPSITSVTFVSDNDFVDLGLSVKWASCNAGASAPWEYGNHYAWGETSAKADYSSDTYTYTDNPSNLPISADAATAACGYDWRTPSIQEMQELLHNCTWTWTTNYLGEGATGYIVTSTVEGYTDKSIFLPAAGYYDSTNLNDADTGGCYWSNSINSSVNSDALMVIFSDSSHEQKGKERYFGLSIRPVYRGEQREADHLAFESYKEGVKISANNLFKDGDGDDVKSLISNAQEQIDELAFDDIKTLDENKANVDAIYQKLAIDIDAWRAANFPHETVDLGLSVLWATCNIGAKNPEDIGNYYAWGETSTKFNYTSDTYTYTDSPDNLPASADAAVLYWGNDWSMPTIENFDELLNNCTWTWTADYNNTGISGYVVTSKVKGFTDKSIFFPSAGEMIGTTQIINGFGFYWSNSLYYGHTYCLRFCDSYFQKDICDRPNGISIRPVKPKN